MELSALSVLFSFQDALHLLICILFAAFAFIWYGKKPTRGRLLFSVGWALAALNQLLISPILQLYQARLGLVVGAEMTTENLDRMGVVSHLYQVAKAVPSLVIGIAFLIVVIGEARGSKKGHLQ